MVLNKDEFTDAIPWEKQRIAKLAQQRTDALLPYSDIIPQSIGEMKPEVWENYFTGVKVAYQVRIDAEKKAEEDRIAKEKAEAAERERIRLENLELKAKAEAREKEIAAERAKQAAEQKKKDEAARKEREAIEKKLKAEKEAREKAEQEVREAEEKKAAELKAQKLAEKKALKAPDKTKLLKLSTDIQEIEMPNLKSDEAKQILSSVISLLKKVSEFIETKTGEL